MKEDSAAGAAMEDTQGAVSLVPLLSRFAIGGAEALAVSGDEGPGEVEP